MQIPNLVFEALKEACEAAVAYDDSIAGQAARGEIESLGDNITVTVSDELDALYTDWCTKSRLALKLCKEHNVS